MVIVKRRRSRTPSKYIYYALHLYFSGLSSLRKTSQHLSPFLLEEIMFQFGIGFKDKGQKRYFNGKEEVRYQNLL